MVEQILEIHETDPVESALALMIRGHVNAGKLLVRVSHGQEIDCGSTFSLKASTRSSEESVSESNPSLLSSVNFCSTKRSAASRV